MHIDKYKQGEVYVDKDRATWEYADSFIQGALLGFCCCGSPDQSLSFVRDVLRHVDNRDMPYEQWAKEGEKIAESRVLYFAYYVLDEKGFLEHGGSVPGWLTPAGIELLEDLNELLEEPYVDTEHGASMQFQQPSEIQLVARAIVSEMDGEMLIPSEFKEGEIQTVDMTFVFEPEEQDRRERKAVEAAIREKLPASFYDLSIDGCENRPVCSASCETKHGRIWVEIDMSPDMTWQEHYDAAEMYADVLQKTVELKQRERY